MPIQPAIFVTHEIRRAYDEASETWWFSVVDIIQVLTQQPDYQTARKYWNKLKERLGKEGSESVTNCHRLKLTAADGKNYLTDVASAETLLRLVQSVPSPNAEPIPGEALARFEIPLPPLPELRRGVAKFEYLSRRNQTPRIHLSAETRRAGRAKISPLQQAFSGAL